MTRRYSPIISCALLICLALPAWAQNEPPQTEPTAAGNCLPTDKIDGSTAEQAKAKIEAAGYSSVIIIRKGCDNFWHATGIYAGIPSSVVLSPDGKVMPDGS